MDPQLAGPSNPCMAVLDLSGEGGSINTLLTPHLVFTKIRLLVHGQVWSTHSFHSWWCSFRLIHLQGDLIAGLTVGLTVIPQGIAYAKIAELSPQVWYGFCWTIKSNITQAKYVPHDLISDIAAASWIQSVPHELIKCNPVLAYFGFYKWGISCLATNAFTKEGSFHVFLFFPMDIADFFLVKRMMTDCPHKYATDVILRGLINRWEPEVWAEKKPLKIPDLWFLAMFALFI